MLYRDHIQNLSCTQDGKPGGCQHSFQYMYKWHGHCAHCKYYRAHMVKAGINALLALELKCNSIKRINKNNMIKIANKQQIHRWMMKRNENKKYDKNTYALECHNNQQMDSPCIHTDKSNTVRDLQQNIQHTRHTLQCMDRHISYLHRPWSSDNRYSWRILAGTQCKGLHSIQANKCTSQHYLFRGIQHLFHKGCFDTQ